MNRTGDDMVERVAAAFINSFSPGAWDTMSMLTGGDAAMEPRARVLRAARAAIAAMREPTEAMVDAAWDIDACGREEAHIGSGAGPAWRAMIDAALSTSTQGNMNG